MGLSISKELAPLESRLRPSIEVASGSVKEQVTNRGLVLSQIMLRRMYGAGMREAVLAVADHKRDIREHFGDYHSLRGSEGLRLTYVDANASPNTPTSIDAAYPITSGRICALGFADILYQPCPGYRRVLGTLAKGETDVVLGLFPTNRSSSCDMVAFSPEGQIEDIVIKQTAGARLAYTWSLAVWRPDFTEFLHDFVGGQASRASKASQPAPADPAEMYVGDVLKAAKDAGLRLRAVVVSALPSLDAGTPETLALARETQW